VSNSKTLKAWEVVCAYQRVEEGVELQGAIWVVPCLPLLCAQDAAQTLSLRRSVSFEEAHANRVHQSRQQVHKAGRGTLIQQQAVAH